MLILISLLFSFRHIPVKGDFELLVEIIDLLDEVVLHGLELFNVLVLGLLAEGLEVVLHLLELRVFLLVDRLDHVAQLLALHGVRVLDLLLLPVELGLYDGEIALELLMQAP